ncbi:hypothetical protein RKE38_00525 [Phycicoccus sp. M110.8]|uniref:hypothetical protein n=1 Tax=Phycicoccus sp. M110.8 TaxID=3075433 RepID=UPI0028FD17BA|nr:hypothetical protein [Phycicoccus sp. M110.8]MDU0312150.1 hypothetical protein [Phycicoccus sp. M110.8]
MTAPGPFLQQGERALPSAARSAVLLVLGALGCTGAAVFGHAVYVDPFSPRGQTVPLVVLAVLGLLVVPLVVRSRRTGPDVGALLVAAWVS